MNYESLYFNIKKKIGTSLCQLSYIKCTMFYRRIKQKYFFKYKITGLMSELGNRRLLVSAW